MKWTYEKIDPSLYSDAALKSLMVAGLLYADVSKREGDKLTISVARIDTDEVLNIFIVEGYQLLIKQ